MSQLLSRARQQADFCVFPQPARYFALLAGTILIASCSRTPERSVERVAILPFENLSARQDLDWVGRAVSGISAARSGGAERVRTFEVPHVRDALARNATRSISGYLTTEGGNIRLQGIVRDEVTRETVAAFDASAPAGQVFALAGKVAEQTGAPLQPYTTSNVQAAEELFRALTSHDQSTAAAHAERALKYDPNFGSAVVASVELLLRSGNREGAGKTIGSSAHARFTPLERARMDLMAAELSGNAQARLAALTRVAEQQPGDADVWTAAANAQISAGNFPEAIKALGKVLELRPEDENALNLRGYVYAYQGDLEGARRAFTEYRNAFPQSANARDSLGEVLFYFGRYAEAAEAFLEAHATDRNFHAGRELFRAAYSKFLAGDLAGADKLAGEYFKEMSARRDPSVGVRTSVWRRMTGRPPGQPIEGAASSALESLWTLASGRREEALKLALEARTLARDPIGTRLSVTAFLLSQPSASAEIWQQRLAQALRGPQAANDRERLVGWALLLDGHAEAAARVWRSILDRTPAQTANEERIMLAWALMDSGKREELRKLATPGFFPPVAPEPALISIAWSRVPAILKSLQ